MELKIAILIILAGVSNLLATPSYSQVAKVSLDMKNRSLEQVMDEIEKQSEFYFIFNQKQINVNRVVNIETENELITDILSELFKGTNVNYAILDRKILLTTDPLENDSSINSLVNEQQQKQIVGTVKDANGNPLAGVTVVVKGTTIGTLTDPSGNYTLSNPPENALLIFSFIGMTTQEVLSNNRIRIDVEMKENLQVLEEIVVTALGISRDEKALSYAVAKVGGESFTRARESNLGNALSGKIPGVNATSTASGIAGSSRVLIRGNGSLSGDNQPLYIVNGIPINNSNQGSASTYGGRDMGDGLSSINPDDIETISILKGGTAAALYGSRAANGVILITTKSGKAQQGIGVEYNSTYTLENPLTIADWQYEYGSGTRGNKPTSTGEAIANGRMSWGAKLDGSMVIQPDGLEHPYVAQKDNIKNFYRTGSSFSNNLAISGGNEDANFRFSVSDMKNESIVPNSSWDRKTFNLSAGGNLSKKIIFDAKAQYNIETAKNRTFTADFTNNPNASVGLAATNIDIRTLSPGFDNRGYEVPWCDYNYVVNPYFAINKIQNEDERRRFIGAFSTTYNITDFLYARARVGIDYFNIKNNNITPTGILYQERGTMTENYLTSYETNAELLLIFNKTFGLLNINAIAGGNQQYSYNNNVGLSSGIFNVPFEYLISNGSSQSFSKSFSESAINSLFSSVDLGFNNFLYLTLTGRQDWFSTLSPESNSLFYPSVGLSYIISNVWNSKPSWLNYSKIRASWAQVGGGAPNPYGLDLTYTASSQTHLGQPLLSISGNTIPNALNPYTSTTTEIGIENRIFNNRASINITVYDRTTTDDIVRASVASASGYRNVSLNIGEIRNRGIELLLNGTPISSSKFSWDISYNLAYNKNTVIKIADGLTSLVGATPRTQNAYIYHYEGQPYGMVSGYKIKQDANGNYVYNKATGMPIQSALTSLGRGVPPLTMGLSNTFKYKSFSLDFLIDGKFGSRMYLSTNAYGTYYGKDKRTVENNVRETGITLNGVDNAGNPFNKVITAQEYYQGIAFSITDNFVMDAGFIKLRQVTFGYSLPQSILSKTPFKSASLSVVGRNLLLLYSQLNNVDPESNYSISGDAQGLENQGVPPTRSFGLNLMVRF